MTNKTRANLRAISEEYVKGQLRHFDSSVPKKDIKRAIEKVNTILMELEKVTAQSKA